MFIHTQTYSGRKSVDCDVIAINVSIILVGVVSVNRSKYDFGSLHTAHTSFTYLEDCENYGGCVLYMNACLLVLQFFSKHIFLQQNICRTARSLHVKWANKLPDLYRNRNFAINLSKTIQCKIKKKNPFSRSRAILCVQTDGRMHKWGAKSPQNARILVLPCSTVNIYRNQTVNIYRNQTPLENSLNSILTNVFYFAHTRVKRFGCLSILLPY